MAEQQSRAISLGVAHSRESVEGYIIGFSWKLSDKAIDDMPKAGRTGYPEELALPMITHFLTRGS